jgi:N-acetylglucosamine-6-phosphate deacetylase
MSILFHNVLLVLDEDSAPTSGSLGVRNGKIVELVRNGASASAHRTYDRVVEGAGTLLLAPGFVEIQFNGGWGLEFTTSGLTPERLNAVAQRLPSMGITSFLATLVSTTPAVFTNGIAACSAAMAMATAVPATPRRLGAEILGLHLEGPFLEPSKRGAHAEAMLVTELAPAADVLAATYGESAASRGSADLAAAVKLVTLAPGLHGAAEMTAALVDRGVVVSLGHSDCTLAEGVECLRSGASVLTHLYNAMRTFHHREPGLIGCIASGARRAAVGTAAAAEAEAAEAEAVEAVAEKEVDGNTLHYELIADGHHVCAAAIALAYRAHPHGAVLTTDSSPLIGLRNGESRTFPEMYAHTVEVKGGRAVIKGTETLAGGCCGMLQCVNNLIEMTGCTVSAAIACATLHPARALRIERRKGCIAVGADADLVLLESSGSGRGNALSLVATFAMGCEVYRHAEDAHLT